MHQQQRQFRGSHTDLRKADISLLSRILSHTPQHETSTITYENIVRQQVGELPSSSEMQGPVAGRILLLPEEVSTDIPKKREYMKIDFSMQLLEGQWSFLRWYSSVVEFVPANEIPAMRRQKDRNEKT